MRCLTRDMLGCLQNQNDLQNCLAQAYLVMKLDCGAEEGLHSYRCIVLADDHRLPVVFEYGILTNVVRSWMVGHLHPEHCSQVPLLDPNTAATLRDVFCTP